MREPGSPLLILIKNMLHYDRESFERVKGGMVLIFFADDYRWWGLWWKL